LGNSLREAKREGRGFKRFTIRKEPQFGFPKGIFFPLLRKGRNLGGNWGIGLNLGL